MKVALGQFPLIWENADANRMAWAQRFANLPTGIDLVILPEMFTTGFTMNVGSVAETMNGKTVVWMKEQSSNLGAVVMGSFICHIEGKNYNRLLIARPNGTIEHYDKRHLFSFASEDEHFTAGMERVIININGFRVCPQVCYDLRFPVWSRNSSNPQKQYDLLVYVANWPAIRSTPWSDLLKARAHENQAYIIGVNRVGQDGNGIEYSGDSVVVNPKGNVVAGLSAGDEGWIFSDLDWQAVHHYREKFRAWDDADDFSIEL